MRCDVPEHEPPPPLLDTHTLCKDLLILRLCWVFTFLNSLVQVAAKPFCSEDTWTPNFLKVTEKIRITEWILRVYKRCLSFSCFRGTEEWTQETRLTARRQKFVAERIKWPTFSSCNHSITVVSLRLFELIALEQKTHDYHLNLF